MSSSATHQLHSETLSDYQSDTSGSPYTTNKDEAYPSENIYFTSDSNNNNNINNISQNNSNLSHSIPQQQQNSSVYNPTYHSFDPYHNPPQGSESQNQYPSAQYVNSTSNHNYPISTNYNTHYNNFEQTNLTPPSNDPQQQQQPKPEPEPQNSSYNVYPSLPTEEYEFSYKPQQPVRPKVPPKMTFGYFYSRGEHQPYQGQGTKSQEDKEEKSEGKEKKHSKIKKWLW
eukprot:gb/GECH01013481.1/.p1 GENE.gb/GECH01013481.1/~~gb/GECH01013481.1/.p1  ORF type:complete len:228 (+),score=68.67 gb/GECH01013481.1/:1-684(+)